MIFLSDLHDCDFVAFDRAIASFIESGIFHKASSLDHRAPTQIVGRFLVIVWRKLYEEVFASEYSVYFKHLEI